MKTLYMLLLCLGLVSASWAVPPAPTVETGAAHRALADALDAKKDAAGAILEYQKALALDSAAHLPEAALDLNSVGEELYGQSRYAEALGYFQQAEALAHGTGSKNEAIALGDMGMTQSNLKQNNEGLVALQESLGIFRTLGDRPGEAATLSNLGTVYEALGRMDEAAGAGIEAMDIYHALSNAASEEGTGAYFASTLYDAKLYALSAQFYSRLLSCHRSRGDKKAIAITLHNLGNLANYLNQHTQAIDFYTQEGILRHSENDVAGEEDSVSMLASVLYDDAQYPESVKAYNRLLVFQRVAGDKKGESSTLDTLGLAYEHLSQYPTALDFFRQALVLRRAAGDPADIASTLGNIGYVYDLTGQTAKAMALYQEALPLCRKAGDQTVEANTLSKLGVANDNLGHTDEALAVYEQALALYQKTDDALGEANTLNNVGGIYSELGQYQKALEFFQQALSQKEKISNRGGLAATLSSIGTTYIGLSDYPHALEFLQRALPLSRAFGDQAGEAVTLYDIAIVYDDLSRRDEAIAAYQQSLALYRQLGKPREEASALNGIGIVYDKQGRYNLALDYNEQALILRRQTGDRGGEATTLNSLGVTYYNLNRYAKALGYYRQALLLYRAVGDKDSQGETLANIAVTYSNLGQYALALDFYGQALLLRRQVGNLAGEATVLISVGATYDDLGQHDKALDYFEQSLVLLRTVGDRNGEAVTLDNIATTYGSLGFLSKALDYHQQALLIFQQVGDRDSEAQTFNNIGATYVMLGQYDEALTALTQALTLHRQIGSLSGEAKTLSNLGSFYDKLHKLDIALDYNQQALPLHREVGDRTNEATTLYNLMYNRQQQGEPRLAIFYGKQAINVYQSIRQSISSLDKDSRKTYLESVGSAYRLLAEILIAQGRLSEAQQVLKLLKEQEFFDFLGRGQEQNALPLGTAELTRREQEWASKDSQTAAALTPLGQQKQALLRKKTPTAAEQAQLAAVEQSLSAAVIAHTQVQRQIGLAFTGTVTADDSPPPTLAAQKFGHNLPHGTVAVYTIVAPDKLFLIVTTPAGQVARESPIAADDLYRKVLAFRNALQDPTHDPRPLAQDLYKIIIAPIEGDLKAAHATTLLWSLDDALRYLPMSALYDGHQYMVERFDNGILTLAAPAQAVHAPPIAHWTGLGLGVSQEHPGFDALPGVRAELSGIFGPIVPGTSLLDASFTQASFLAGLKHGDHPLVHIASHFALSGRDTDSFLLLGDGGHLSLAELKADPNVFAGVDLLTLSACNTAMEVRSAGGKEVEGFGALAQRLGARSVLASLWPVADASTPVLMREFYRLRHASRTMSKASGLRQAQIELLQGKVTASTPPSKTNRAKRAKVAGAANLDLPLFTADPKAPYAHPYYWAPFVLIGDPQ